VAKQKYYVVWVGHQTGVFTDWATCSKQVLGAAGAKYKSYPTLAEAEAAFNDGIKPAAKQSGKLSAVNTLSAEAVATLTEDTLIYTDGGCEPNPGEAGSGMAIYRDGTIDELWYGLYNPNGTNNTAELNALHQALLVAKDEIRKDRSVSILCDSKYSIQCVTQWAVNWKKNGWTKSGGEIKNLEIIKTMFALHQSIKEQVNILHVNGHVGVEGNELADRMSIYAMEQREPQFSLYTKEIDVDAILALRTG